MNGLRVVNAGLQTTVQAGPFTGLRDQAMPYAGAADPLSLALANRLAGKALLSAGLEITLGNASFESLCDMRIACTGAPASLFVNDHEVAQHSSIVVAPGDLIRLGPLTAGGRNYMAFSRSIEVPDILGSQSTYVPAGLGGFAGRALVNEDVIPLGDNIDMAGTMETPMELQPRIADQFLLRTIEGPESSLLDTAQSALGDQQWCISKRSNRMGLKLEGEALPLSGVSDMKSGPVFPGTIQCPPDGLPYLLGVDGQTTGGYPRIAQVIRADRHLMGQLAPGARVQFQSVTPETARTIYIDKIQLWAGWLPGLSLF